LTTRGTPSLTLRVGVAGATQVAGDLADRPDGEAGLAGDLAVPPTGGEHFLNGTELGEGDAVGHGGWSLVIGHWSFVICPWSIAVLSQ
jgi:hypothetical protein